MIFREINISIPILLTVFLIGIIPIQSYAFQENDYINWNMYKGDNSSSSYSSLDQINKDNVHQLEIAWIYRTGDLTTSWQSNLECNSIVVDAILYCTTAFLKVFALNATTGEELWVFDPFKNETPRGLNRAVVYWEEDDDKRILFIAGNYLFALNADNGEPILSFGSDGKVDLNFGLGRDPNSISVTSSSPGIIYNDVLVMGSRVNDSYDSAPGHIRAYNVKSGEMLWKFNTIPDAGQFGAETWKSIGTEAHKRIGGANAWAGLSLDKERGIVYIPTGAPAYDFYGGHRKGENLFANSILALKAETGEYLWHYQTVHHDLWDYDLPAPPNLLTLTIEGKKVDALAQVSKTGFTFVLNRVTGEPLFPIFERPVPASNVEGEEAWPTQPFPSKPPAFVRQYLTYDEVTQFSTQSNEYVKSVLGNLRNEGLFTPPDPKGTILFPGTRGGANWGGAAHDPSTGILFINANESPEIATVDKIVSNSGAENSDYERGKSFYMRNCAVCHGFNKEGNHPTFPSLLDIGERRSKESILTIIKEGSAMMPSFQTISESREKEILAFLNEEGKRSSTNDSNQVVKDENTVRFLNITAFSYLKDAQGNLGIKPPWGTLNAIDLNKGEILWKVPLGTHPDFPNDSTGIENWGGPIVTAGGLVFISATPDKKFRAFDKETGKIVWEAELPSGGFTTPSTFMVEGKQYIVIGAGGGRGTEPGDHFVAFTLQENIKSN